MICSMCPTLRLSNVHAPSHGWQCPCRHINCSHMLRCSVCGQNRYDLERDGRLVSGRPTQAAQRTDALDKMMQA